MKAYIALTVANEIDGNNTVVRVDKASTNRASLEEWASQRNASWREKIKNQNMVLDCVCQMNIIEVEIEG